MTFSVVSARDYFDQDPFIVLKDVTVENRNWIVIDGGKAILPWTQHHLDQIAGRRWQNCNSFTTGEDIEIIDWPTRPRIKVESAVLIGGAENYYHFTIDYLANLVNLDGGQSYDDLKFLVAEDHQWQSDLLSAYRIPQTSRLSSKQACLFDVKNLIFLKKAFDFEGRIINHAYAQWIHETHWTNSNVFDPCEFLYVSRDQARCRRVQNEPDLLGKLQPLGFKKIDLETMTIFQQIDAFRSAKIIVGPSGAGFTNIIYSKYNPHLIEFMPSKTWRPPQIQYLTEALSLNYTRIIENGAFGDKYFSIDVEKVYDRVRSLIDIGVSPKHDNF